MNSFSGIFKRVIFFVLVSLRSEVFVVPPRKDGVLTSRLRQRGATSVGNNSICQRKAQRLENYNIPAAIRDIKNRELLPNSRPLRESHASVFISKLDRQAKIYISSSTIPLGLLSTLSGSFQRLPNQGEEEWKIKHRRELDFFFFLEMPLSSPGPEAHIPACLGFPVVCYLSAIFPWLANSRIVELGPN